VVESKPRISPLRWLEAILCGQAIQGSSLGENVVWGRLLAGLAHDHEEAQTASLPGYVLNYMYTPLDQHKTKTAAAAKSVPHRPLDRLEGLRR